MLKQFATQQAAPVSGILNKISNLWFRIMLAVITGSAVAWIVLPVLVPILTGASSGLAFEAYSHIARASAFVAYLLLWTSMLAGLSITGKLGRKKLEMSWRFGLHRYTALLGLGFAFMHALSLLKYMNYTLAQLLVPFMAGSYKPHWLGLGQLALYSLAIIAASFYARDRLGLRSWRLIHSLSFALFLMALMHGVQSGSDSSTWWAQGLYWASAASVLLGSVYRVMAVRAGRPKEVIATTGWIAVAGKAQGRPMPRVLKPGSAPRSGTIARNPMQPVPVRVLAQE